MPGPGDDHELPSGPFSPRSGDAGPLTRGLSQGAPDQGPLLLRNGQAVELRPLVPGDLGLLEDFLRRLSPEAREARFMAAVAPEVATRSLLENPPGVERQGLVILSGGPASPRIIAHGEYVRDAPDSEGAEIAFLVEDAFQGLGIGSALLERLTLVAVRRGIRRFWARTSQGNRPMLEVFRSMGFALVENASGGEVEVALSLQSTPRFLERYEFRERVATVASLAPFFEPRGVAVFGVSRSKEGLGRSILRHLREGGYPGGLYPIHPQAEELEGLRAFPDLTTVPGPVDLAVLAVPAPVLPSVVDDCGRKGVHGLVVVTGGYDDRGEEGARFQRDLVERARGWGMRVLGPATLGLTHMTPPVRLNASLVPGVPLAGAVAFASQSGALGVSVLERARERGLGFSSFVSLGDKTDVSSNDLLQYWEDDPAAQVVLLYLESFGNPRRFARLSRRVGRSKPLVALKSLRTGPALRAAEREGVAPLVEDPNVNALFEQSGVLRVARLEEALDLAELLVDQPLPAGPRVLVVTNAKGPGVVAVDALLSEGLAVPEISPDSQELLRSALPGARTLRNPVDLGIWAQGGEYQRAISWGAESGEVDALLVLWIPLESPGALETRARIRAALQALGPAKGPAAKPALLVTSPRDWDPDASGSPFPVHHFPEPAARALGLAYRYARWRATPTGDVPEFAEVRWDPLRVLMEGHRQRGGGELPPSELGAFADLCGFRGGEPPSKEGVETALEVSVGGTDAFSPVMTLALRVPPLRMELPRQRWILPITGSEGEGLVQRLEQDPTSRAWTARDPSNVSRVRRTVLLVSRLVEEFPELERMELTLPARDGVVLRGLWTTYSPPRGGPNAPARTP